MTIGETNLVEKFNKIFSNESQEDLNIYFSPTKINLLGDSAYNSGGLLLSATINLGVYFVVKKREDSLLNFYFDNKSDYVLSLNLKKFKRKRESGWRNNIVKIISYFKEYNYDISHGMDVLIYSNTLSDTSYKTSLKLGLTYVFKDIYNINIDIIRFSEFIEKSKGNNINNKLIDEIPIIKGRESNFTLIDTRTLRYQYIPFNFKDESIIIFKTHSKIDSNQLNKRFLEIQKSYNLLKNYYKSEAEKKKYLCDFNHYELESSKFHFIKETSKLTYETASHCIKENNRILSAVKFLRQNKNDEFNKVLVDSHLSLNIENGFSNFELEDYISSILDLNNNVGMKLIPNKKSKIIISFIDKKSKDDYINKVKSLYKEKFDKNIDCIEIKLGEEIRKLKMY